MSETIGGISEAPTPTTYIYLTAQVPLWVLLYFKNKTTSPSLVSNVDYFFKGKNVRSLDTPESR